MKQLERLGDKRIIGFIGAGGTGKTTTAKALHDLTGWPLILSSTKKVMANLGITSEADQKELFLAERIALQEVIQKTKRTDDVAAVQANPNTFLISDRTPFDHIAYDLYYNHAGINEALMESRLKHAIEHYRKYYACIFYFPLHTFATGSLEENTTADAFRTQTYGYRYLTDLLMRALLTSYVDGFFFAVVDTAEKRASFIMKTAMTFVMAKQPS